MSRAEIPRALLAEAERANERRIVVIAGQHGRCIEIVSALLDELPVGIADTCAVTRSTKFSCVSVDPANTDEIMGTTHRCVILDLHESTAPNVIGRTTGTVDGGGLLFILCPSLTEWPSISDDFDRGLVVDPFTLDAVGNQFKNHLIDTLEGHPGIAIYDIEQNTWTQSGLTDPPAANERRAPRMPVDPFFPLTVYEHCWTADQVRILTAFERLRNSNQAVIVSADRGRGKSSAAGMAGAAFASQGESVVVTAPRMENTKALFERAASVLDDLGSLADGETATGILHATNGASIEYLSPLAAIDAITEHPDRLLFVDEAAGVPVETLTQLLTAERIGFTTTRHGYEGAGHGFAIRFRERITAHPHEVTEWFMAEPIRYAASDPIESWLNHTLFLDAKPPVESVIEEASVSTVQGHHFEQSALLADDVRLREMIGLLALAHYRTEPDDLARMLDAPNLAVHGLVHDGHVVSVALIAREGGLSEERRDAAYRGERLRGNLFPDIFINVFRDRSTPGRPGCRIVRLATHPAVRRRGLGSQLIEYLREFYQEETDWLGAGFGATPAILSFWFANGFVPISLSANRNQASGAHSAMLLDATGSPAFSAIDEFAAELPRRLEASLSDVHRSVDPAVVVSILSAAPCAPTVDFEDGVWRRIVAAADGPGRYDLDPGPVRRLVIHHLIAGISLDDDRTQLLVRKVLQGERWEAVASEGPYQSIGQARRALGTSLVTLLNQEDAAAIANERQQLDQDKNVA